MSIIDVNKDAHPCKWSFSVKIIRFTEELWKKKLICKWQIQVKVSFVTSKHFAVSLVAVGAWGHIAIFSLGYL